MTQPNYSVWSEVKKTIREEVIRKQEEFCRLHQCTNFLASCDECPKCKTDIVFATTEREAEIKHIVSCPICNFSLCE